MQFENMNEEELDQYAHHAAEYLWCTARTDPSAQKIVKVRMHADHAQRETNMHAFSRTLVLQHVRCPQRAKPARQSVCLSQKFGITGLGAVQVWGAPILRPLSALRHSKLHVGLLCRRTSRPFCTRRRTRILHTSCSMGMATASWWRARCMTASRRSTGACARSLRAITGRMRSGRLFLAVHACKVASGSMF